MCSNDPHLWEAIKEEEAKLKSLTEKEEVYWRQRSRALWLKSGDQNTKYFHYKASARRKKNEIKGLIDDAGFWQEDECVVQDLIIKYFSELFTSSQPEAEFIDHILEVVETKISTEINNHLLVEFTCEEVCRAVK